MFHTDAQQPDRRYLLAIGVPLILGVAMLLKESKIVPHRIGRLLNPASSVLVIFPIYQLITVLFATLFQPYQQSDPLKIHIGIDERVSHAKANIPAHDTLRDIYVIMLDAYPRDGSLPDFDNSEFISQLEERGFYVDPQARSNYLCSPWSITSSLNMNYINIADTCNGSLVDKYRIYNAALDHSLGRIVTELGYQYIHISSGFHISTTSRYADIIVDFSSSGRTVSDGYIDIDPSTQYEYDWQNAFSLQNRFMKEFLKTTLTRSFMPAEFFEFEDQYYEYSHPSRTLDWIEFMKEAPTIGSPKFLFTHLVRPHSPYNFDRHGNISSGWGDQHDPEVGTAFFGQVLYLNARLLEVIDAILAEYSEPPIMIIMSDHGHEFASDDSIAHDILAAYLLPDGGHKAIYQSITSVNVFRAILNYYFHLDLELLEDKVYPSKA